MTLPKTPWRLSFMPETVELKKMQGKPVEPHTGYTRTNDGSWIIVDADGNGIAQAAFRGRAKRGEAWCAPDPEGQRVAATMAASAEMLELLKQSQESIGGDWRQRRDELLARLK